MDRLADVKVFVTVVETSSFSRAAAALGISRSHASRAVAGLEARLQVRLLHRTTRKVAVTATGQAFYDASAPLLDGIEAAEARVRAESRAAMGTLRVSVPSSFGIDHLVEPLVSFQALHPEVRLVTQFDERKVDLLAEGIDLAVRGGEIADGHLVARALWPFRILPAASPAYLARHGTPAHPSDLTRHACLTYGGSAEPRTWLFASGEDRVAVTVDGPVVCNSAAALVATSIGGAGVVFLPDWALYKAVRDGALVRILPDWLGPAYKFWLVRPDRRHVPERVRAFQEHLLSQFPSPPWLELA
ncbi:MAG: LysR family transcriptional regulator [Pseudomonadota bacterium]|nr:LysR family transcriptional regulator [Pseudomonadota bacterium]